MALNRLQTTDQEFSSEIEQQFESSFFNPFGEKQTPEMASSLTNFNKVTPGLVPEINIESHEKRVGPNTQAAFNGDSVGARVVRNGGIGTSTNHSQTASSLKQEHEEDTAKRMKRLSCMHSFSSAVASLENNQIFNDIYDSVFTSNQQQVYYGLEQYQAAASLQNTFTNSDIQSINGLLGIDITDSETGQAKLLHGDACSISDKVAMPAAALVAKHNGDVEAAMNSEEFQQLSKNQVTFEGLQNELAQAVQNGTLLDRDPGDTATTSSAMGINPSSAQTTSSFAQAVNGPAIPELEPPVYDPNFDSDLQMQGPMQSMS